jgi:hypothetical protein
MMNGTKKACHDLSLPRRENTKILQSHIIKSLAGEHCIPIHIRLVLGGIQAAGS